MEYFDQYLFERSSEVSVEYAVDDWVHCGIGVSEPRDSLQLTIKHVSKSLIKLLKLLESTAYDSALVNEQT